MTKLEITVFKNNKVAIKEANKDNYLLVDDKGIKNKLLDILIKDLKYSHVEYSRKCLLDIKSFFLTYEKNIFLANNLTLDFLPTNYMKELCFRVNKETYDNIQKNHILQLKLPKLKEKNI